MSRGRRVARRRRRGYSGGVTTRKWHDLALLGLLAAGCARPPAAPPPVGPTPGPRSGVVEPDTFRPVEGPPPSTSSSPGAAATALRREIFVAAWTTIRDKHFDRTLGGIDWEATRRRFEPLALGAPDDASFYRVVNQMLGQLGQSHLQISGPGADEHPLLDGVLERAHAAGAAAADVPAATGDEGDPGVVVRIVEDRPTVTRVRAGSAAARVGLRPGFVVTHVGGRELRSGRAVGHALRPVEERFLLRLAIARLLAGPVGSQVTLRFLDESERPREVVLPRDPPAGAPVQIGLLPPLRPEVQIAQLGDVGVVSFNFFLLDPVLGEVQRAIDLFRARGVRGLVLDLRGNPGGLGAMAIPVAARLVDRPLLLGTIQFRDHANVLRAVPSLGVQPYLGPVAVLTDEGTASTSEMLAAGLQEAGRAVVVGGATPGAALPSVIEALPGGAILQYAVADFRTPKNVSVEGRGVIPDVPVEETRAALLAGRDPVMEAAVARLRRGGRR